MDDGQSSETSKAVPWLNDGRAPKPGDYGGQADVDLSEHRNSRLPTTNDMDTSEFPSLWVDSRFSSSILKDNISDSNLQTDEQNGREQASGMSTALSARSDPRQFNSPVLQPSKRSDVSYDKDHIPKFLRLKIFDPEPLGCSAAGGQQPSMNVASNPDGETRGNTPVHRDAATPRPNQNNRASTSKRNTGSRRTQNSEVLCEYSADLDEKKWKRVKSNLSTFVGKLEPRSLLPHLRICLTDEQYEHVRCQIEVGKPRQEVNRLLLDYLKRAPCWWQHLEEGLKPCGSNQLLQLMQSDTVQRQKLSFVPRS